MIWAHAHQWRRARMLVAFGAALLWALPALAQSPAVGVRLGVSADGTRVVIDSPTEVSATPWDARGRRLVFTVTGLDAPQMLQGGSLGVVKDWRLEAAEDGARLTLDLSTEASVEHRFLIPPSEGVDRYRYVIDLAPPAAAEPAAAEPSIGTDPTPVDAAEAANEGAEENA